VSLDRRAGIAMPIRLSQTTSGDHSQHGESGVIDAVFRQIGVKSRTCVEFGAYDLKRFSNVYPLWTSGWRALLIEGDPRRYAKLRSDYAAHPQHGQQRVHIVNRFVAETGADSLDSLLTEYDFPRDVDLVCIDVDGQDFHIWRGLQRFDPRLVVIEYNPTIPPHIELIGDGNGNNVGCSALALARLGGEKGYSLIACIGWNAFFVHREHAGLFVDSDDLDALFDYSYLRYAMQSYGGEVFFSAPLHLPHNMFCQDSAAIERSSVSLGRTRNTLRQVAIAAMRYCLRPVKRLYRRARGR
jgi:hypothetical protein